MLVAMLMLTIQAADAGPRCLAIANRIEEAVFTAQRQLNDQSAVVSGVRQRVKLLKDLERDRRRVIAAAGLPRSIRARYPAETVGAAPDLDGKPFEAWRSAGQSCAGR